MSDNITQRVVDPRHTPPHLTVPAGGGGMFGSVGVPGPKRRVVDEGRPTTR